MSLNFHWSKNWYDLCTSCNVFCMQAWHFRNFQIRASLCSPCYYIFRAIYNKEFERNLIHLHTAGSYSSLSECSLGKNSMFILLFLTVKVNHKQPQQVMDFSLFLFALYLLWDNFLIPEMTTTHVNNTTKKTPCQPQSVHSRQRPLVVSCRRFGTRVGGCEIFTAVLKIHITWDVSSCWLINLLSSSGPTAQDEGTMFHRIARYLSPVDRAPSSPTPVWKRHV